MSMSAVATPLKQRSGLDPVIVVSLAIVLIFFAVTSLVAYLNLETLRQDNEKIVHSGDVISVLDRVLSSAQDAETGQRGFLLTADEKYLQPYNAAIETIH